jgi:hypothetical protein
MWIGREWEPALEPRYSRLRHQGHIQAFTFSFFNCSLLRVLAEEADGPSHWNCRCGIFGLLTSTSHGLSKGRRGTVALRPSAEQVMETLQECGQWWGYLQAASHVRCHAVLALRDTAEGPYPQTSGGPGSCCMG